MIKNYAGSTVVAFVSAAQKPAWVGSGDQQLCGDGLWRKTLLLNQRQSCLEKNVPCGSEYKRAGSLISWPHQICNTMAHTAHPAVGDGSACPAGPAVRALGVRGSG